MTEPLQAGVARSEITPPTGIDLTGYVARLGPNVGVLDPVEAGALVLLGDTPREKAAFVTLDILGLSPESVALLRQRIAQEVGIPGSRVMFACSHTHSGPATQPLNWCGTVDPAYMEGFYGTVVRTVEAAAAAMVPVTVSGAYIDELSLRALVMNRRRPDGPVDPRLHAVLLRRDIDGQPVAGVIRFTCHAVVLGGENRLVSADWVGHARRRLEQGLGGGALALVANGPAGNINPALRGTPELAREMGENIGRAALAALAGASKASRVLRVARQAVDLPLGVLPDTAALEGIRRDHLARAEAQEALGTPAGNINQRIHLVYAGWAGKALQHGLAGLSPGTVAAEVQALRLGESILVGLPGEPFAEFGLQLQQEWGSQVIPLGYTNVNVGYVPWPDAYAEGGYEVNDAYRYYDYPAAVAPVSAGRILAAARRAIAEVLG